MHDRLGEGLENGALAHPLKEAASSVDLFQALAHLSGAHGISERDQSVQLRNAIGHHDHYVFVLVDGLGMNQKTHFPSDGFFLSSFAQQLHSVFPSTTAVALTSLATCTWPAQHGLSGWWTHFPEYRRVIAPLLFAERVTGVNAVNLGLAMEDLVAPRAILGSLFRKVISHVPHWLAGGAYDSWFISGTARKPYRNFRRLRRAVVDSIRRANAPTFQYVYVTEVDGLSHEHGVDSDEVHHKIHQVDALLGGLRSDLPQSARLVVSADHGLVDVPRDRVFVLRDDDPVCDYVEGGQTGEGRAPVFHVIPGKEEQFLEEFSRIPAACYFSLHAPEDLAQEGLYGPPGLTDPARLHFGTFVGISDSPARLEYVPGDRPPVAHTGVHGGLLKEEMIVPLFLA